MKDLTLAPLILALCGGLALSQGQPTTPGKRIALAIGNNAYVAIGPLRNCVNDARAIQQALEQLGFTTRIEIDADRTRMAKAVEWLEREARGAQLAVFFYSGHGIQIGGVNYLVPVDLDAKSESAAKREALSASEITEGLTETGCQTSIVILDACRNNPFTRGFRGSSSRGLAPMNGAAPGSLIAFAADANQLADDNQSGENGLYTTSLLRHLKTPGLRIEDVFMRTRKEVNRASAGRQIPAEYNKLEETVYLLPAGQPPGVVPPTVATPAAPSAAPAPSAPSASRQREPEPPALTGADLRTAAERGDAKAQYALGRSYFVGRGVAKDLVEAAAWFRKSAEQGCADAQVALGTCYEEGTGVEQDAVQAAAWYRKSAKQGEPNAGFRLAKCYEEGRGVEQDLAKAVAWYRKAALQGHVFAQRELAICYQTGRGVEPDPVEAAGWYRKAAEQGDARSQCKLGASYETGSGVDQDAVQAVAWYRKAAEQGDARAQYNLGMCYRRGLGVEKDPRQAGAWLREASHQGFEDAKKALEPRKENY